MNNGPSIFFGLFAAMAVSWLAFVLGPELQIGGLRPTTDILIGAIGQTYPTSEPGIAHQGAEIYRANGCAACHTQQIRPRQLGYDIDRGWGVRRSTAYDYLYEQPLMLGTLRIGPDLANAGHRNNYETVLMRLYEPRSVTPKSIMPPYPFLFEKRKINGRQDADALPLEAPYAPEAGYEIVPLPAARKLAGYVMSLRQNGYLFEAPPPAQLMARTNAPAAPGKTNAPVAAPAKTNSPAK